MSKYFKLSIFLCFFLPTISFAQVKDTNNNTFAFTESGAYKFSRKELIDRRRKKVDFVLIGYGQKPNNPMLYYLVPVSKVKRKMSENALRKYQVGIPVCDLSFAD